MARVARPPLREPPDELTGEPLPAPLSWALVAFTIECDNAAEARLAHRTTARGPSSGGRGPWLVSTAMWFTCMRYVDAGGITLGELIRHVRTPTNLDGMRRWGYITVAATGRRPRPGDLLTATPAGLRAADVWAALLPEVEQRWRERFGAAAVDRLRAALAAVVADLDPRLPDCLPILGHGLFSRLVTDVDLIPDPGDPSALPLPVLLARTLLAFAVDYETGARLSLAIASDVLPALSADGGRVRDLPAATGVSKEAIAMATRLLAKAGLVELVTAPGARERMIRLTEAGESAQTRTRARIARIAARWGDRFGAARVAELNGALAPVVGDGTAAGSPLFAGLDPPPGGWRSELRRPLTLPRFPMVSHRGGFPDGS